MNSSAEQLWHDQKKARNKILFWILAVGLGFILVITVFACWITQPLFYPKQNLNRKIGVSADNLKKHVQILSEDFYPRSQSHVENLNKTADYIKTEFEKAGGKVSEQTFQVNGNTYRNIIAEFGKETSEKIIVGAHYDSAYQTHGADDNASGVAGLIELAKLFGKTESPMQIQLVAFTLEEPPFYATEQMGSFIHAKSLKNENANVRLMISLEMIGYFSDEPNSQKFPVSIMNLFYPSTGNFIAVIGNFTNALTVRNFKSSMTAATDLPVYSANAPTFINGVDFSDHRSYWNLGYNAVMITDTAFYRNHNYHLENDTVERIDYERMAEVVEATYKAILDTAK